MVICVKYVQTPSKIFFNKIVALLVGFFILFISVSSYYVMWRSVYNANNTLIQNLENTMLRAFDRVDDLVRSAEAVIEQNRRFFFTEESDDIDSGLFETVQMIRGMASDFPFVAEVVFYRANDDLLITTIGTATKQEFFTFEHINQGYGIEFWDNLMNTFHAPAIVPLTNHRVPNIGAHQRIFVIPRMYPLHNVGVLIFVNEVQFMDYCGLSLESVANNYIWSLYNSIGQLVLTNGEASDTFDISRLSAGGRRRMNMFGFYEHFRWFDYGDTIVHVYSFNRTVLYMFVLMLMSILLSAWIICKSIFGKTQSNDVLAAYRQLKEEIRSRSITGHTAELPKLQESFRLSIAGNLGSGDFAKVIEIVKGEVNSVIESGLAGEPLRLFLAHIYFVIAEAFIDGETWVENTFQAFLDEMEEHSCDFNQQAMVDSLLNVVAKARHYSKIQPGNSVHISEVLEFIKENYNKEIYLDTISEKYSMTSKKFSALFKRRVGIGFVEYLTSIRLEHAKKMLIESDKSIGEISKECGFSSPTTFTMSFKKHVGKTPNQYRNR